MPSSLETMATELRAEAKAALVEELEGAISAAYAEARRWSDQAHRTEDVGAVALFTLKAAEQFARAAVREDLLATLRQPVAAPTGAAAASTGPPIVRPGPARIVSARGRRSVA